MSKRSLSPAALPPSKRLHSLSGSAPLIALTFDSALYEELVLLIFAHLSWVDLCAAQGVSKNWASGLWKSQYLQVFGRKVKKLPERAAVPESLELKDWRWMFRISWNWKKGHCSVEHIDGILKSPRSRIYLNVAATARAISGLCDNHRLLYGNASAPKQTLLCGSPRHRQPFHITALALDQSPPLSGVLRLAVFLSTGEFMVFSIHNPSTSSRELTYVPLRATPRTTPIIQAVYHHPLLISLSEAFTLSLYDLSSDSIAHTQTLTTYTTFPPSSLILSAQTPGTRYKLVLTYAVPIFPVHFSIGVTELIIHASSVPGGSMSVVSTRTARALDVPAGWIDQEKLRSMREQWGRKLLRIQDTQSDGKWVVLAPGEPPLSGQTSSGTSSAAISPYPLSGDSPASLQLYRLFLPPATSVASPPPKLTFIRYLHHTAGAVSSMALADGRCVTLGKNGGIWVWDLESGTGAEVAPPSRSGDPEVDLVQEGTVVFDDRRIITARGGILLVHRFDI
ncbi:hypothetical protein B0H14DRAFT_3080184 [Mycena olivaceomarginata]|nr:hypothetical protein B0H14DRAFT_3080184 [Mycena olivaceomarginata]